MSTDPTFKPDDIDAVIDYIKANPLPEDKKIEALEKIEKHASDPENISELVKAVEKLSGSALAMDGNFDTIGKLLGKVHAAASQGLQDAMNGLSDKWKGYREAYTSLLWRSRSLADTARAVVDDFGSNVLPFLLDDTNTTEERKAEVQRYRKILDENGQKAADVSQGFTELSKKVTDFQKEWSETAVKFQEQSSAAIKAIDDDIKRLNFELGALSAKIKTILIAAGVGLGVVGAAVLWSLFTPFGFITPLVGLILALVIIGGAAIPIGIALSKSAELSKQLVEKEAERKKLVAAFEAAKQIESELKNSEGNFAAIIVGLNAFTDVWATIRSDLNYVSETLGLVDTTSPTSPLNRRRLSTLSSLYFALGKALEKYAKIVRADLDLFKGQEAKPTPV